MRYWFISRHGEAEPYATNDKSRRLTERGQADLQSLWQRLKEEKAGELPTAILASPYVRAQESAAIIAETLGITHIKTIDTLVPEGRVSEVLETLQGLTTREHYLVVSHMPLVGHLYAHWVQGLGSKPANFSVAQVVALTGEPLLGEGKVRWHEKP